ncbi:MAG: hypothetical protein LUG19_11920 [Desulfovibrio sp.]|uniref:hypothetical protein n=1 Tax=Desulfovibrio sp. TaxID=885 RepID=UPI00258993C9|nr:hypothetical protein [Desulfovibrio sp.]MCD7984936.1 hypothetical protein [Desulfovibrio sp.]
MSAVSGNRCGHDPRQPKLTPAHPIRKGKGGLPRILSLAAERAKAWYYHPKKCPPLLTHTNRQTRSERREACQIVLETILSHLDLASMCLGVPTPASGFIDIDMRTIVRDTGIGQRRCERAIALFKEAGFMKVTQPRTQNEEGGYFGCRAIRVVTETLFEWLGLGPMLRRERARASERLRRKAQKLNRKVSDFMSRVRDKFKKTGKAFFQKPSPCAEAARIETARRWNMACAKYMIAGFAPEECRRRTNAELGLSADYSPGRRA